MLLNYLENIKNENWMILRGLKMTTNLLKILSFYNYDSAKNTFKENQFYFIKQFMI